MRSSSLCERRRKDDREMNIYKVNMVNSDVLSIKTELSYDEFLKKIFNGDRFIQVIQDVYNGTLETAICPAHIAYVEQVQKRCNL